MVEPPAAAPPASVKLPPANGEAPPPAAPAAIARVLPAALLPCVAMFMVRVPAIAVNCSVGELMLTVEVVIVSLALVNASLVAPAWIVVELPALVEPTTTVSTAPVELSILTVLAVAVEPVMPILIMPPALVLILLVD